MWIPRPLYEALPYVYLAVGAGLLVVAYLLGAGASGWLLLLGALALVAGMVIWMRRRDYRSSQREYRGQTLDE